MTTHHGVLGYLVSACLALGATRTLPAAAKDVARLGVPGLCSSVSASTLENQPTHPLVLYQFREQLGVASGVLASDSEHVRNEKIGRYFRANMHALKCNLVDFTPRNGNFLKLAVARLNKEFVDEAIAWKVDVNFVDPVDGRTILDYFRYRRTMLGPGSPKMLDQYDAKLRAAGAKYA